MFEDQLASLPAQPPREVLPGMRLSAAVPRGAVLLVLLLVAFFAILPLSLMSADPMLRLQLGDTRVAQARVLSLADARGCGTSAARRFVYEFSAGPGRKFHGIAVVCEDSPYYATGVGETLEIRYLASDPAIHALRDAGRDQGPPLLFFMLFPLFFLIVLAPMYVPQFREVMRARRLYRSGLLTTAHVVFVRKRTSMSWPGWPGRSSGEVFLAYQLPNGTRRESTAWCANDWLLSQLSRGAPVHIAFSERSPKRVALLEAFVR